MKWLVVSSHDERYDFNLEVKVFEGTIEDFQESPYCSGFDKASRIELRDGIYCYHSQRRSNKYCNNISEENWDIIKDNLEVVEFETIILIPFENLNEPNFIMQHPIVHRNVKFGFLDIKSS